MNATEYLGYSSKVYTNEELTRRVDRLTEIIDLLLQKMDEKLISVAVPTGLKLDFHPKQNPPCKSL